MIQYILSTIIFLPLISSVLILFIPEKERKLYRYVALASAMITLILTSLLVVNFDFNSSGIQFVENSEWIKLFNINYLVGADGLSITFLILAALFFLLGILTSWNQNHLGKGFFLLFLILETTILGTFCAQDLFLFFTFWVASIPAAYFMINIWGNKNREYVASRFFIHHFIGSGFFLLGMLAVYYAATPHSFNLIDLAAGKFNSTPIDFAGFSFNFERLAFILIFLGLATRIPIVPLHSWLPQVQTEAPTPVAVILAVLFIKTGAYALLRINDSLFPRAASWIAPTLAVLGVVNIIYGAICALGQKDFRRLVAYSCISQMGVVILGLSIFSSSAFNGAFLQMVAHSVCIGMLFFLIGILGTKAGHYFIIKENGSNGYGGLVHQAPILTGFFTVALFAALGIPGLGVFNSELLIFLGGIEGHKVLTIIALMGVLILVGCFLWAYKHVFLGVASEKNRTLTDLSVKEMILFSPLILLCIFIGAYPAPILNLAQPALHQILSILGK